jgi:hypothetical protein
MYASTPKPTAIFETFNTLIIVNFFLFGCYLVLLTWLVIKTPFFKKLPVPLWMLAGLFLIKVAAGIYYGWFFSHMPNYKVQADTWRMYYESLTETSWLKNDPGRFFSDLYQTQYQQPSADGILATSNSYWNNIKSGLVIKLMAVCNLLTGNSYYINVLFFEYVSFFGPVASCRLFIDYFPNQKWPIIAGAFLFPSTLLWCSGFHKEGLLLTSLAMAAWLVNRCFIQKQISWLRLLSIAFHLLIIFLLRNYLALFFVLWCLPWIASYHFPSRKWQIFIMAALVYVGLFFSTIYITVLPNLPEKLAARQQEFLKIPGESIIQPIELQPNAAGYSTLFPAAITNGFLQPLPWNIKKLSYLPAATEIALFVLLILNALYVVVFSKSFKIHIIKQGVGPLLLFCSFFSATVFLLIGYTIPYLGAIVRYKAVVWPFIILPLLLLLPTSSGSIKKKNMKEM